MASTPVRLIVTDLDGTLIGGGNEAVLFREFVQRLQQFKERYDTDWAVCTGRSLRSFKSVLEPMRAMGVEPKYVIIRHAFIYRLGRHRYWPHVFWNALIRFQIWSGSLYLCSALNEWHRLVRGMVKGVKTIYHRRNRLCLRFSNETDAEMAADLLRKKASVHKHLRVFHYMLEVDVRTVPFTKGMAVRELAGHLGLTRDEILTIGDGHNDISMLDGISAASCGCPANAKAEVMSVVHQAGGHIASERGLKGVIEIMDVYLKGEVNSALPEWWLPNCHQTNPKSAGRRLPHHDRHQRLQSPQVALKIVMLAIYTVLLVFANFGLLPFSDWIIKPFTWVSMLVEKILIFFSI